MFDDDATEFNPLHIQLEERVVFYDETTVSNLYRIQLEEHVDFTMKQLHSTHLTYSLKNT